MAIALECHWNVHVTNRCNLIGTTTFRRTRTISHSQNPLHVMSYCKRWSIIVTYVWVWVGTRLAISCSREFDVTDIVHQWCHFVFVLLSRVPLKWTATSGHTSLASSDRTVTELSWVLVPSVHVGGGSMLLCITFVKYYAIMLYWNFLSLQHLRTNTGVMRSFIVTARLYSGIEAI